MVTKISKHFWTLVVGDAVSFYLALFLAISIRALGLPRWWDIQAHLVAFSLVFVLWFIVFYIAGLYELRSMSFKETLASSLLRVQLINSSLAIFVFYLIPAFGIAPKTTMFIDLLVVLIILFFWRTTYFRGIATGIGEKFLVLGESAVAEELRRIIPKLRHTGLVLVQALPADTVVLDLKTSSSLTTPELQKLMLAGVRFLDLASVYETVTGSVHPATLSDRWVLENLSLQIKPFYTVLKRLMDIIIATPLFIFSLVLYPFVYLAIKLEDGGSVFITQERVGEKDRLFKMYKFRRMTGNDSGNYKRGSTELRVTKVGAFLRKSRIDELPQLLTVIMGEQSLVGPRPELPALVEEYRKEIPYYDIRHSIKPGMSGWAQIYHENHPHHGTAVELTRGKLSYDLYYIKNRSFILDLKIALKTIRTLLSRVGI